MLNNEIEVILDEYWAAVHDANNRIAITTEAMRQERATSQILALIKQAEEEARRDFAQELANSNDWRVLIEQELAEIDK
jgi:hypothetical protein